MQMRQAWSYQCSAHVVGERAPQGHLEGSEKFFETILSTFRVDPGWQARVTRNAQQMQQIELKGIRDRSAIVSKNAEDIRKIQQEGYENQQRTQEKSAFAFDQVIRGVETYRNPDTGETMELSNNYGHAWVNGQGEYLLSDSPNFDPNTVFKENWKQLEHVKN
jgi:hypothetical protein